ncbi:MAG TPA: DUF58 domain-containing protein [candidate division Zixibacteria bacterium]|nr:DUF58 domain-containing protein [candidate division Zixibacteria bacterium]
MIPKEIFRKIRRLDIRTNKVVKDIFSGKYHSVFKGRGMEFTEVREYVVGDDIRNIDWNVTARTGEPYVKIFEEERELTVMLMVDVSSSGEFGTATSMKRDIALEICALLAFSAIDNNDLVGLIMFTDKIERCIMPKKGKRHVLRILRELLYFKPEDTQTDLALPLDYLNKITKRSAIAFMISDFIGEGYEKAMAVTAKKHDLVPIVITDPRELEMPGIGLVEMEDAETGTTVLIDTSDPQLRSKFGLNVSEAQLKREKVFKSIGVDKIDIRIDKPYIDELIAFFKKRAARY